MKTRILLFMAVISVLAASCTKDSTQDVGPQTKTIFTVSSSQTRTSFGELQAGAYPILWQKGDCISVNGTLSEPLDIETPERTVKFTVPGTPLAPYDIVYPGTSLNNDGKIEFPSNQTYINTQFDPHAQIMLAHGSTQDVQLKSATAFIRVTVNQGEDSKLRSIKLYSYDGTPLSGLFTPDYTLGTLTFHSKGRNFVSVSSPEGIQYEGGSAQAVLAIPAGEYPEGFAIAAVAEGQGKLLQMGKRIVKFTSQNVTKLEAGKIYPMVPVSFQDDGFTFSGGTGTEQDPYKIATAEDLMYLSELTNGSEASNYINKYYVQMADIDMSAYPDFRPIANTDVNNTDKAFLGVYDGNDFLIENLHISASSAYSGFIGFLGTATASDAEVKNLTFENCSITGTSTATGMIVGESYIGKVTNCHLKGCAVNGVDKYTGGVVGTSYYCDVRDCTVDKNSSVTSTGNYTGGLVGCSYPTASLTNSYINCEVHATVTGTLHVGGIIGFQWTRKAQKTTVKECVFTGNVSGTQYIGGIIGSVYNTSYEASHTLIVSDCSTSGGR